MGGRSNWAYWGLIALALLALTALRLFDPFPIQALRLIAFDSYQRLAPRGFDPSLPVRVVDIDEASLLRHGQWPWSRAVMADLVNALERAGAASISFDVLFAEPDRTSFEEIAQRLPAELQSKIRGELAGKPSNDEIFAEALTQAPSVLAATLASGAIHAGFKSKAGFAVAGDDPKPFLIPFESRTGNLPILEAAASGIGAINWIPDRDQVVRRVPLLFKVGEDIVPSLAAEALRVAQGASTFILKASNANGQTAFGQATGLNHLKIGAVETPTDSDSGIWLSFRPSHTEAFIPAWKVLSGEAGEEDLFGAIVLVGTSAPGLLDLRATPLDAAVPGVEIHAQLLEHLLSGRSLTRPDYAPAVEIACILLFGLMLAFILPQVAALASAAIGLLVVALLLAGGWFAFDSAGLLFDPLFPSAAVFLTVAVATYYTYRRTEIQRGEVRGAFGRYVAPAVVDHIIADPSRLKLGGEVRQLTLLFCDVRNFTSISERMSAAELTQFINELLTPLSEVILKNLGTIDKYMGDAIMAFWNAPIDQADHAARACRTAMEMARAMPALNKKWKERAAAAGGPDFPPVRIGIGLNTGDCCVGNLGSEQRFDYSAIGDDVNVASRFEGLTKHYGLPAIAGEATVMAAPDIAVLEVDLVRVKGRGRPARIYTFLDLLGGDDSARQILVPAQEQFLACYRAADWDGALKAIEACQKSGVTALGDYYALFIAQIAKLRLSEHADWDGVFTATEK